jgi:outer membrane protein TolC
MNFFWSGDAGWRRRSGVAGGVAGVCALVAVSVAVAVGVGVSGCARDGAPSKPATPVVAPGKWGSDLTGNANTAVNSVNSANPANSATSANPASAINIAVSDPVLENLLRAASTGALRMIEQEAVVAQNDAFRFRGWRQHMPYINASYSFGDFKLLRGENRGNDEKLSGTYSVGLRYPIFAWGAVQAEKEAALLRERAAMLGATLAWRQLVESIREQYYRAVMLKSDIALQKRQLALEARRQEQTAAHTEAGRISTSERLARSVATRDKEATLATKLSELEILLANLRATTGVETFSEADVPDAIAVPAVDADALERQLAARAAFIEGASSEVVHAGLNREILDQEITRTRSNMLPVFNAAASISQSPYQTNTNRFEMQTVLFAGINGSWNVFDRDTTLSTVRALKARQRHIDAQLRATKTSRAVALRAQVAQIRASQRALALRREHLDTGRRNLDSLRRQRELGLAEPLAVENAAMQVLEMEKAIFDNEVAITRAYQHFLSGIEQDPANTLYTAPVNE